MAKQFEYTLGGVKSFLVTLFCNNFAILFSLVILFSVSSVNSKDLTIVDPETGTTMSTDVRAPRYLYHWASRHTLQKSSMYKTLFGPWSKNANLGVAYWYWREFYPKDHRAVFAWTNPVTGMAADRNTEVYGSQLVRLEIDPNARVLHVTEGSIVDSDLFEASKYVDPKDYDILFRDTPKLKEWIVLNPAVVKNAIANPKTLEPVLVEELRRLRTEKENFPASELHYTRFNPATNEHDYQIAYRIIETFLNSNPLDIPPFFRENMSPSCEILFL